MYWVSFCRNDKTIVFGRRWQIYLRKIKYLCENAKFRSESELILNHRWARVTRDMANPLFPIDTIKDIADSLGIVTLSGDAAKQLAMDVECRIQEVIQEALKFMRHSKRTVLSPADISNALRTLNIEVAPFFVDTKFSHCTDIIHLVPLSFAKLPQQRVYNYTTWMMRK